MVLDDPPEGDRLFRIAFGSCNRYARGQKHWSVIAAHRPDIWLWTGDIVYADTQDMDRLQESFATQKAIPEYAAFAASTRVIGVWDDHDFGDNNLDGNAPHKEIRQRIILDFLDEPSDSERRSREGIYTAYDIEAGQALIRIVLLDLRYFQNVPPGSGNLLGAEQWRWFETQLRDSPADLNLVVSSSQVLREDTRKEGWAEWPAERDRLYELIRTSGARNVMLISGDLHAAELSRIDFENLDVPLYEVTSSGLTHSRGWFPMFLRNPHREALYLGKNFGQLDLVRTEAGLVLYVRIYDIHDRVRIARSIPLGPDEAFNSAGFGKSAALAIP